MVTPNPSRGEATVTFGSKSYLLKFNMSAIRKFEQRTGRGLAGAFHDTMNIKFDDVFTAILLGVETANESNPRLKQKLSAKRLDRFADMHGEDVAPAMQATVAALVEALPKSKAADEEDDDDLDEDLEAGEAKSAAVPLSTKAPDSSTGPGGSPSVAG